MIGVWGGTNRIKATLKFFLYTFFGSVLMLGAILYLAYSYSRLNNGVPSFDYFELQRVLPPRHVMLWLYGAFTLAFIIKVPMWPLHTWLPDAHTEAPTAGSVILAAVMLKMGTYGYMRFCMGLFPEAAGIFSIKPLVGHCQAAGAAVEVLATIYAFQTGYVPAPPQVAPGHPRLVDGLSPRRPGPMLKSSIGMGGYNTAVVLGEPST